MQYAEQQKRSIWILFIHAYTFIYRWFWWGAAIFRFNNTNYDFAPVGIWDSLRNVQRHTHSGTYNGKCSSMMICNGIACGWEKVCAHKFHPFVFWLCEGNVTGLNKFLNISTIEIILLLFLTTASSSSRYLNTMHSLCCHWMPNLYLCARWACVCVRSTTFPHKKWYIFMCTVFSYSTGRNEYSM